MKDPSIGDWWSYDTCVSDLRQIDSQEELDYARHEIAVNHEEQMWEPGVWASFDEAIHDMARMQGMPEAKILEAYRDSQQILHPEKRE